MSLLIQKSTHSSSPHHVRLRNGGREIGELGLLLRRKPAEDDGLEAGVGVLGDGLQTLLDHDLERTGATKDAGM